ncbi:hypothetical protein [Noviherbaspirillum aerium]|uniref:hypothetical protein n=1 Tax=Noviherbaspirillum aerium TaxID=2588497 RepID=UPI00124E375A|nr:hypothetical protein [Noviherbaspirillum aerium]
MNPVANFATQMKLQGGKGGAEDLSEKDLRSMLAQPKLGDKVQEKLINELAKRLEAKLNSGKGTSDDMRQLELLSRLKEGTITESENDDLGQLMGVKLPDVTNRQGSHTV